MKLTSNSPVLLHAYNKGIRVDLYGKKVVLLAEGRGFKASLWVEAATSDVMRARDTTDKLNDILLSFPSI